MILEFARTGSLPLGLLTHVHARLTAFSGPVYRPAIHPVHRAACLSGCLSIRPLAYPATCIPGCPSAGAFTCLRVYLQGHLLTCYPARRPPRGPYFYLSVPQPKGVVRARGVGERKAHPPASPLLPPSPLPSSPGRAICYTFSGGGTSGAAAGGAGALRSAWLKWIFPSESPSSYLFSSVLLSLSLFHIVQRLLFLHISA